MAGLFKAIAKVLFQNNSENAKTSTHDMSSENEGWWDGKLRDTHEEGKNIQFAVYENEDDVEKNTWYRLSKWNSQNILRINFDYEDRNWKYFVPDPRKYGEEDVVGVSYEGRQRDFLIICDQPEFKMYLEREPDNDFDKNAIKVMGSALINGRLTSYTLGYISKEVAELLADEDEISISHAIAHIPYQNYPYQLKIKILERTKAYKKKHNK